MTTMRTVLRGVARVYHQHEDARTLCFVFQKQSQLGKAPTVEQATLLLALFAALADVGEVFDGKNVTRFQGGQNGVCDAVVHMGLKPCPATRHSTKVSFRAFCAFGLKFGLEVLMLSDAGMHPSGGEKLMVGGDCDALDAQVAADDIARWSDIGSFPVYDHMQVEASLLNGYLK